MKSVRVIFRNPKKTKQNPPKKPTTKKAKEKKKKTRTTQLFSPTQLRLTGPPNNTHLNLIKFVPVAYELLARPAAGDEKPGGRPREAIVDTQGHSILKLGKFPSPRTESALGDNLLKGALEVGWPEGKDG